VSPETLRKRREALRAAGEVLRRRPAGATLDSLCRVLDAWRNPESMWRKQLADALPVATGFSPETVREGLRIGLENWTGASLHSLVDRELPGGTTGFETTALLLAGSIPMPSLIQIIAPLLLSSPVLAKCASRDPVTPGLAARSIGETDRELGDCIAAVEFPSSDEDCVAELLACECIVATGSDATVAAVRRRTASGRRLVEHGHRLSLAALGPAACHGGILSDVAGRLALDVALWDQLGCLSPIAVYAVGEHAADAVTDALANAFEDLVEKLPRGRVEPAAAALFAHERAEAEFRASSGSVRLRAGPSDAWAVVREQAPSARPAPLHRFVRVFPVEDAAALPAAMAPYAGHLAGVAIEGFARETKPLSDALVELGASRICAPGSLQAPPIDWNRDGRGVLRLLARRPRAQAAV
jgi:hypothetical protein